MPGLPRLPTTLRLFSSRLALEQSVRCAEGGAVATDSLLTFSSLTDLLGAGPGRSLHPVAGRLLVRALLLRMPQPLRAMATEPSGVRSVHRALLELRSAGLVGERLRGVSGSPALRAIAELLVGYEAALAERGVADEADRQRQAVLAIARWAVPPALHQVRSVVVEGEADLFGARLDILRAFAAAGVSVRVVLPWDDARRAGFTWPEASAHALEARAVERLEVTFDARLGEGPLAPLRAAQFSGGHAAAPVRVLHCAGEREQARQIAAQIVGWLRRGVPCDQIAVVTPDVDGLGAHVVRALRAAGVPAYCRRGPALLEQPQIAAVLAGLLAAERGFSREELLDVWCVLGRDVETPEGIWPPDRVAAEVRRAGARSARVRPYRQALIEQARRDEAWLGPMSSPVASALADALDDFMAGFSAFAEAAPLTVHLAALGRLLRGVPWRAASPSSGASPEARTSRGEEAADALEELFAELRAAAHDAGDPEVSRGELVRTLELLLGERRLPSTAARAGAVHVGAIEDLVGASFACVVVAGVDGESFPRAPAPDPVLTQDLRVELNRRFGPRLLQSAPLEGRGALHGEARDVWLWLEVLASAQRELLVTYSVPEGDEPYGRSVLVEELLRSLGRERPDEVTPVYAVPAPLWPAQALESWSFARLATGPSLTARPSDRTLEPWVRAHAADAARWLEHRVRVERAVRGAERRSQPLAGEDLRLLESHFFDSVHSTSRLDLLGKCAFLHFASAVLRLARDDVPTLGADPREEGNAAHAALYVVYRDVIGRGGLGAARRDVEAALGRAREVFDAARDEILREVVVHPALRAAVLEEAWRIAEAVLKRDLAAEPGLEPVMLEHRFGDRPDAASPALELFHPAGRGTLRVRGSIDRVDVGGGMLVTLDYKRTVSERAPHRHFQLGLYTAAALREVPDVQRVASAWIGLRDEGERVPNPDCVVEDRDAFLAQLARDLWARVDRVLAGDVRPDPEPVSLCERCDYRALCRVSAELVDLESSEEDA